MNLDENDKRMIAIKTDNKKIRYDTYTIKNKSYPIKIISNTPSDEALKNLLKGLLKIVE